MVAGALVDSTGSVRLAIPHGWAVADDVGAVLCEAPAAQADITGRVCAGQLRIEAADRGALVPRLTASGRRPDLPSMAQQVVADTFAGDPTAVLINASQWFVRTGTGGTTGHVAGIRIDMAHHDMTTPTSTTTILVDGGQGVVRVTASIPVAHHGALGAAVEQALSSLEVAGGVPVDPWQNSELSQLDPGSWEHRGYRPSLTAMDTTSFDVFARGSHKISPRWRPQALAAGLVEAHGVATETGHYVRRAVSRPDLRLVLQVWEVEGPVRAEVCVDLLERRAVLRSSAPAHFAVLAGGFPAAPGRVSSEGARSIEVQDMAAVPARLAAWLGLGLAGPGSAFLLGPGLAAGGVVSQSMAPGVPATSRTFGLNPWDEGPAQLWSRLVALLV